MHAAVPATPSVSRSQLHATRVSRRQCDTSPRVHCIDTHVVLHTARRVDTWALGRVVGGYVLLIWCGVYAC
ncbi:hypothetical protein BDU57DRAFT_509616 [Ampelomyces quisqualis]|uniref:Uncharacterized protein n=1 Tax=Ampelomyces quisqualis TaxID=50730 RepID=A0A6A5R1N1_AMPQU|nr:hypothetical protein BDU57DRAFT_509616 [Ampelomyces quisqualis]